MTEKPVITHESVWNEFEKGQTFNEQQNLNEVVKNNENFFIGKQWEGVEANGLPTPVFNFLKRVVLFTVASITSDNVKMQASALRTHGSEEERRHTAMIAEVVNAEFDALFESNGVITLLREYMRNAAVDGDGCTYTYWDPDIENGEGAPGGIVTEIVENTRVFFGNPNDRRVQKQPYIILSAREMLDSVKEEADENGEDPDVINEDSDHREMGDAHKTDGKVTTLLRMWKDKKTRTVWMIKTTKGGVVRDAWDTGLKLYPVTWMNFDYVQDNYHGMAMISGLIPNQVFINKLFAMSMISLMTTAYPKIVYDRTRVPKWDNRVGAAIPVNGGDVTNVAKIIDPAQISPQIAQFIELAVNYTQTFLGATSAALGDTRPDNTSAIIALQRAAAIPNELSKQNLYKSLEDLGRIYIDFMGEYYGKRSVEISPPKDMSEVFEFANMSPAEKVSYPFDFAELKNVHFRLKLDVGASSYWSEIATMQTMDNLLMQGKIDLVDYLERVPDGYITKRQELVDKLKGMQGMMNEMQALTAQQGGAPAASLTGGVQSPIPETSGYGTLQRKINETGVVE